MSNEVIKDWLDSTGHWLYSGIDSAHLVFWTKTSFMKQEAMKSPIYYPYARRDTIGDMVNFSLITRLIPKYFPSVNIKGNKIRNFKFDNELRWYRG
mgnify:CR=1 FL=1